MRHLPYIACGTFHIACAWDVRLGRALNWDMRIWDMRLGHACVWDVRLGRAFGSGGQIFSETRRLQKWLVSSLALSACNLKLVGLLQASVRANEVQVVDRVIIAWIT